MYLNITPTITASMRVYIENHLTGDDMHRRTTGAPTRRP
jgi:hypothetical protein